MGTTNHVIFCFLSVLVYGVHRGLMCPKYVLKPDKDKNDIHYFSYLDGTIFLPNTFNTYSNNHYCIENVVFGGLPENNQVCISCFMYLNCIKIFAISSVMDLFLLWQQRRGNFKVRIISYWYFDIMRFFYCHASCLLINSKAKKFTWKDSNLPCTKLIDSLFGDCLWTNFPTFRQTLLYIWWVFLHLT